MSSDSDSAGTVTSRKSEHVTMRRTKKSHLKSGRHDISYDTNKINFKVPQFASEDPELWFALLENQFESYNVTDDLIKFATVINNLDIAHAKSVKDIIMNPPVTNRYDKIKNEILRRLSASRELKVKQLLNQEKLGDRKPSQFLRHLQDLAGTSATDDLIKQIWTNQLPINLQTVLVSQPSHSLEQLADLADRIHELTTPFNVASTSSSSAQPCQHSEIAELKQMVERLALRLEKHTQGRPNHNRKADNYRSRPQQRNRSSSRQRSRSNSSYRRYPICWYHSKYGSKAHRCIQPCDFNKPENSKGGR
ncbi:uncharacterized protein LOC123662704 [Melitaea cinxia]|uniref:uncharacterized protein LOC123662704 n=1 Tax=Melitaea cinxia TaxID=113334 RepID=UPI001E273272|nr:uncharacterized protein LOC123662704 [Melitaea cinxia]